MDALGEGGVKSTSCRAAVIVPAYDEARSIAPCLESLAASVAECPCPEAIQIVVVDNGSRDRTGDIARGFSQSFSNLVVAGESRRGPGYARATGAELALSGAAGERAYWLLSTDADTIVPRNWLPRWLERCESSQAAAMTGVRTFGADFQRRYPRTAAVLTAVGAFIERMEGLFSVINFDGFNGAVERSCYAACGPFVQPRRAGAGGKSSNLAGEDWDLGCRARALGFRVRRERDLTVTSSPRRIEAGPLEFLDGTAYERPFDKVETAATGDLPHGRLDDALERGRLRAVHHFAMKPMLVCPELLDAPEVRSFLGAELRNGMLAWMQKPRPPRPVLLPERVHSGLPAGRPRAVRSCRARSACQLRTHIGGIQRAPWGGAASMSGPATVQLLHFTHVGNLTSILRTGQLLSDAVARSQEIEWIDVARHDIKARRRRTPVCVGAGGTLTDFVPFYFAPRSPMLEALSLRARPTLTVAAARRSSSSRMEFHGPRSTA